MGSRWEGSRRWLCVPCWPPSHSRTQIELVPWGPRGRKSECEVSPPCCVGHSVWAGRGGGEMAPWERLLLLGTAWAQQPPKWGSVGRGQERRPPGPSRPLSAASASASCANPQGLLLPGLLPTPLLGGALGRLPAPPSDPGQSHSLALSGHSPCPLCWSGCNNHAGATGVSKAEGL